ncbi:MAG TPA: DedA family protein [Burkholderiales bacterium]|nr:DedA family protein [Burkholderiales bacterium]
MPDPDAFTQLGYLAVLAGAFLEGEVVVFLAGLAAQNGYLSLPAVIGLACLGAFLGDQLFYFIGRRYGNRLLARFPRLAARAPRVQAMLRRWDVLAIVLVRFAYGIRMAGPIVIGGCGIPAWRVALFNLIGVLLWAPLVAGLGYFAGQVVQQWIGRLPHPGLVLPAALVFVVAGAWLLFSRSRSASRRRPTSSAGPG